ncbi:MAG: D-sedoheptulose 7-phosphate isomerase [Proteobacteria bacterium]|nr:D-sedoheptulose 7-phosphate isomerase [Pseudomonadota bacterium]
MTESTDTDDTESRIMDSHINFINKRIITAIENLQKLNSNNDVLNRITDAARLIVYAIKSGNKLMICGNGGSAADAQHVAGEFVCRFYKDREPLPAIALTTDTSVLTSISNDYSYDDVFNRQVKALGKSGDVLFGISTSGSSGNVLEAFRVAKTLGIKTILLTGQIEKEIAKISDLTIHTPSTDTPRIQEMHLLIEHIICEIVEKELFKN